MSGETTILIEQQKIVGDDRQHYLVVTDGPRRGMRVEIRPGTVMIGRSEEADLDLGDRTVSSKHCDLIRIGEFVMVRDLGSTNGTFIDGIQVRDTQDFPVGSALQVGATKLYHEYRSQSEIEEQNQLTKDIGKAASYVRSLLPSPIHEKNLATQWRFIPSAELSGDAFGYHWIDPDHFAIYLVDVCGHGAGSSLHAVSVINSLRQRALAEIDFRNPSEVLRALNEVYPMEEYAGMYFTIWYGVYAPEERRLTYASAGHPPALLLHGESSDHAHDGTGIGLAEGLVFEEKSRVIEPDSRLYVFSDGAFEILTLDGREWTLDEFLLLLKQVDAPYRDAPKRVEDAIRAVMRSKDFEDDFSLMAIEFLRTADVTH